MHRNAAKVTLGGQRASWLGVNFWSRTGGPLMWRNYDSQVIREELRVLREHGLTMTRSFFYWPDFMPGAGAHRRADDRQVRRLPRPARRGGHDHGAHVPGRPHVRGELGPRLAERARPVLRRLDGGPRGVVRRGDGPPVRQPPGRVRLARLQRDADLRRRGQPPRDGQRVGPAHHRRHPGGGRHPAGLARRRGVGHRGQRGGQRLLGGGLRAPVRFPRTARLPGRQRPDPPALRRRLGLRAGLHLRRARGAGGVRRQLRLHRRPQRRALLPAGAAQLPAGRRDRLDGLEQHRLRRPRRAGPLPASRVRDALRADRLGRASRSRSWPRWPRSRPSSARSAAPDAPGRTATPPWSCRPTWTPSTRSRKARTAPTWPRCSGRPTSPPGWPMSRPR